MSTVVRPRWLTEADVAACLDMATAITALRDMLEAEAAGQARSMAKAHTSWEVDGARAGLHVVGGVLPATGLVGVKSWAHTPGGAAPLVTLFDSRTGALRAVIEAFALGQLRTGAMSGIATDLLADPDATELTVIGTGKQALPQVAAVAAVRRLERVTVWGRDHDHAVTFVNRVQQELELPARVVADVSTAVRDAHVITLVTRATLPLLTAEATAPGTHINAVGAITRERMEFEPALLQRCATVAVDSVVQARELSSELRTYFGADDAAWQSVRPLSELVAANARRSHDADLTLFKPLGIGLADVAVAARFAELAEHGDLGTDLPARTKANPRLRTEQR